jgi:hypothetical protein
VLLVALIAARCTLSSIVDPHPNRPMPSLLFLS